MRAPPLLELNSVNKCYRTPAGNVEALHALDLAMHAGEFVAVTGPSGSGKSTLLNLATLLDRPTRGSIRFANVDTDSLSEQDRGELRKHSVSVIFQNYHLLPDRTVLENVLFRFRYMDTPLSEATLAAHRALELTGLTGLAQRPARLLSGGEMQRTAIARAVAVPLRLLAADEPTGNLDAESATQVMRCLAELNRGGTAILLVTHDLSLLRHTSRHIAFRHGQIEHDRAL
ncbi:MAG: ABC transporter ATP-binding protein [Gammaproteobacteria bacterium]